VRLLGLAEATDIEIWDYAKGHGFLLVSLDADFADIAALRGSPPKLVWLRRGNRPTDEVQGVLRDHFDALQAFDADGNAACLEIY
jgi:predicted nuclease of predicted toxin-antitoxin system